jgi:hypothetical protein
LRLFIVSSPTMMARMSVDREVAEHCLAHVLPGVEKVYNRYNYLPQKREAFEKLAELVERIVTACPGAMSSASTAMRPPAKNVRHLHRRPCAATYRA